MAEYRFLTPEQHAGILWLINAFEDHGCGMGYDRMAQTALRRLLAALKEAEEALEKAEVAGRS